MKVLSRLVCIMAVLLLISCATTVPIQVTKPPLVDMSGIQRISVIPFGYAYQNTSGSNYLDFILSRFFYGFDYKTRFEQQVVQIITNDINQAILKTQYYTVISSSQLTQAAQSGAGYASVVDAYLTGEVNNLTVDKKESYRDVKDAHGNVYQELVVKKTVKIDFTYRFVRASNGSIIGQVNKKGEITDTQQGPNAWNELKSDLDLATKLISNELHNIERELAPWKTTEYRAFESDKTKDPRMKEANKLVKSGSLVSAQNIYNIVYTENGNFAAGYNEAIITELLGNLQEAINLMQNVFNHTGNPKASKELSRMKKTLADQEILATKY